MSQRNDALSGLTFLDYFIGTDLKQMSSQMKDFLMSHYESRENKPWNIWKTIRKNQLDQFDVSDDDDDDESSSDDENEKLARFLQAQTANRRKTFEMWLTDKEAQLVKNQTVLAGKAKKNAMTKEREATRRQLTGKTFQKWLEEKSEFKNQEFFKERIAESEQSEERKAEAVRKYQEWLRAKDEEALAREDRLREEAAAKFTETKQKRDEKMQRAWYKKKLSDMF